MVNFTFLLPWSAFNDIIRMPSVGMVSPLCPDWMISHMWLIPGDRNGSSNVKEEEEPMGLNRAGERRAHLHSLIDLGRNKSSLRNCCSKVETGEYRTQLTFCLSAPICCEGLCLQFANHHDGSKCYGWACRYSHQTQRVAQTFTQPVHRKVFNQEW